MTEGYTTGSVMLIIHIDILKKKSNRKAMNRNWGNQKANPALKTKTGKKITNRQNTMRTNCYLNREGSYFPKGGHSATQTELKV